MIYKDENTVLEYVWLNEYLTKKDLWDRTRWNS